VNVVVWFLTSGIVILHLSTPPCGLPTNGIVAAAIVKDLLSCSRWWGHPTVGEACAYEGISLYFLFCLDTKKETKKIKATNKKAKNFNLILQSTNSPQGV
jgi:hypothetical protein